ncbi:uncharacterized protein LODBEIA_P32830 [Lodderomyces beijingensis]|uniref:RBR-type E3 ubiquitin transferase n=1 Tax=Lodderomyces beijingensis TaxID=1775926 RepID=A0ABP0ZLN8_9ASCO
MANNNNNLEFSDDPRLQELQSCGMIYESLRLEEDKCVASITIPLKVAPTRLNLIDKTDEGETSVLSSATITHLTPIDVAIRLVEGYPESRPPEIKLSCPTIDEDVLGNLQRDLLQIWDDYRDLVVFSILDHIHQNTETIAPSKVEVFSIGEFVRILEHDQFCKQEEFNGKTFTCEICQSDYKGTNCTQFENCQHVFCNECLTSFFTANIVSGEIDKIHCPEFTCTKKHLKDKAELLNLEAWMMSNTNVRDIVKNLQTPPVPMTILKQLLAPELIERYLKLFKNTQFELVGRLLPNRLVRCPRTNCEEMIFREELNERLVVCPVCRYAFCFNCLMSYHARFKQCAKVTEDNSAYGGIPVECLESYPSLAPGSNERKILNAKYGMKRILLAVDEYQMDQLFESMMKQGTNLNKCPNCGAVIEKSDGCNRMKCGKCDTHFCFNCGDRIGKTYDHFSDKSSNCYGLLFFGMPGVEE